MSFRTVTSFVVDCDVCLHPFENGDHVALFGSTAEAEAAAIASEWVRLGQDGLACPKDDLPHQLARHQKNT
ncbi:hypothetical protein [Streptomyces sp. cmx-4-9]|uniref:hypothetical protein n=1 Tax=Streptomyces sp. cmx-4-9 TaxID=2790941 RepID=UPI00397EA0D5